MFILQHSLQVSFSGAVLLQIVCVNSISKLKKSPFFRQIIKGTFWLSLGTLFSRGLLALSAIVLVRILSVSQYGEYGMVKSTIDNFLIFASMGVGLTTTKYISELKSSDPEGASSILGAATIMVTGLSLVVFLILTFCSGYITTNILENPNLQVPLITGSLVLVFVALNGIQTGALLGLQSYRSASTASILQGILIFTGLCVGGYLYGVTGAIAGNLIATVILAIFIHRLIQKEAAHFNIRFSFKNWRAKCKVIYKFAIPASLSTMIVAPAIWVLNTMLVKEPGGYAQLGLYNAAFIFCSAIQMLNSSLNNVLLPILLSKDEQLTPQKEYFNYFGTWIVSFILAIPVIIFPNIAQFVLGDKYNFDDIKPVLLTSIVYVLITAYKNGLARDLIVKNKMWLSVFSMGQYAITALVLFYFMFERSAFGYALSITIAYVINLVIFIPFFIYVKISPRNIFYNFYVIAIWILIFGLLIFNFYAEQSALSSLLSLFVIALILYMFARLNKSFRLEVSRSV